MKGNLFSEDPKQVQLAIEEKQDIEQISTQNTYDGKFTPLLNACFNGWYDCAKVLLENHADVNRQIDDRETPLHFACFHNKNAKLVKLLLEYGAQVNQGISGDGSPLHVACDSSAGDCALILIRNGAEILQTNGYGNAPLLLAAVHNLSDVLDALLSHPQMPHRHVERIFSQYLTRYRNLYVIKQFIKNAPFLMNSKTLTDAACVACQNSKDTSNIIKYFLELGVDCNAVGEHKNSLLHYSCKSNNLPVTIILLKEGANPNFRNAQGETPLLVACEQRRVKPELIKELMRYGAIATGTTEDKIRFELLAYKNVEKAKEINRLIFG